MQPIKNIKGIRKFLLILAIVFFSVGAVMLLFDLSYKISGTSQDSVSRRPRPSTTVNGWGYLLIGAGILFGRTQFKEEDQNQQH